MFYDFELLCRGGKFGLIWIAGTRGVKALSLGEVRNVNTYKSCDEILAMVVTSSRNPRHRLSVYLTSKLLLGLVRVHYRQAELLLDATLRALSRIRKPLLFAQQEKNAADAREKRKQRKRKITEDVLKEVQPVQDISDADVIKELEAPAAHIARTDQITLAEPTETRRTLDEPEFGFEEDINFIRHVMERPDDVFLEPERIVAPQQRDLDHIIEDIAAVERTPAMPEMFAEPAAPEPIAEQPQPRRPSITRKKKGTAEIPFITTKKRITKKLTKEIEYHDPALMLDENENLLMSSCFRYPSLFDKFIMSELNVFRDSDVGERSLPKSPSIPRASKHKSASLDMFTFETSKEKGSARVVTVLPSDIQETLPPVAEQSPGPIDISAMEIAPSEPVYMESPPRVDRDQSPQAVVSHERRLKEVVNKVRRWYSEKDTPLTIEDIAEKPLSKMTVAVAFFDLLDLHKRGYVVLKPLKDSIELDTIELGPRLLA